MLFASFLIYFRFVYRAVAYSTERADGFLSGLDEGIVPFVPPSLDSRAWYTHPAGEIFVRQTVLNIDVVL